MKMAEAAFSDDGKYYAVISQDGRLRIWDTETNVLKQEYTPDLHLTSPPSCLQWINVLQNVSPHKSGKRKNSVSAPSNHCVVLGTSSGKILIYSVTQAKVETVLYDEKDPQIQDKSVTALDWHRKYGLFCCNKSNIVTEWDLTSAKVKKKYNVNVESKNKRGQIVNVIKLVPHNLSINAKFLVTASWQIKLWRLEGSAVVIKALGHSTAPRAVMTLATLKNRSWLIEGSQNERLLSFWDVTVAQDHTEQVNGDDSTPNKKQRKKSHTDTVVTVPTYNFVLEDAPKIINVGVAEDEHGTKITLVASTRSGVVHYYGHMLNGSSTKPIKPSVTLHVTTPDAKPLSAQCCLLIEDQVLIGYNKPPALIFERITPDLKSKTQVLIRGEAKSKSKDKQIEEATKVRTDKPIEDITYVEPLGGVTRKRMTPGGNVEVPMESRLANLSLDIRSRNSAAVRENLTKLLVQGLHSKDKNIIQTVLQKNEERVAMQTVSNLPPQHLPLLLEQLADMATKNTFHCQCACTWLTAVMKCHSALLLATSILTTNNHLTQLLAIFTQRRSHLCQLLNLKGRIDLTIAQRSRENAQDNQEALLEYKDDTSSESEMEIEQHQSSASDAESWEEDKMEDDSEQSDKSD